MAYHGKLIDIDKIYKYSLYLIIENKCVMFWN